MSEFIVTEPNIQVSQKQILLGNPDLVNHISPMKYQWAWDMSEDSFANYWRHQEVPMAGDYKSFRFDLNPEEQRAYVDLVSTLSSMDLVIGRNVAVSIYPHITCPEVESFLDSQIMLEGIHKKAYHVLLQGVGLPEEYVYSRYLEVPEIAAQFNLAKKYTTLLAAHRNVFFDDRDYILNFLEAITFWYGIAEYTWFCVKFAPLFALSRRGKMPATAEQVRFIFRDEALAEGTELLTPKGWKPIEKVTLQDEVAQWNPNGEVNFVSPIQVSNFSDTAGYIFETEQGHVKQVTSVNHRMAFEYRNSGLRVMLAKDALPNAFYKFIHGGKLTGNSEELSPLERLLIAAQADGNISPRYNGERSGQIPVRFSFKKERKIARLKLLCKLAFLEIREHSYVRKDGLRSFDVMFPLEFKVSKRLLDNFTLQDKSYLWCEDFINEISLWDGHNTTEDRVHYSSIVKENADFVQAVASLANYRTLLVKAEDSRSETYSDVYRVHICKHKNHTTGQRVVKSKITKETNFYCVQVPSSFLITRNEGSVTMTGNCQHGVFGTKLVQAIAEDTGVRLPTKKIIKIFIEGVEAEINFARKCLVNMPGFLVEDYIEQVKFVATKNMKLFGVPAGEADLIYGSPKNKFPWLDEQTGALKKEKNFFETTVSEYTKKNLEWGDSIDLNSLTEGM